MQFRQGDVLLELIDREQVPDNLEVVQKNENGIVLSYGEKTGHSHRIEDPDKAAQFSKTGEVIDHQGTEKTYVVVEDPVELVHEEHDAINLPKGTFVVRPQREYSPEGILPVID